MPTEPIPFTRRKASAPSPVNEVHIIWITAGLGCDGDSVSVTAAEQPSLEDVILGAIPGLPKVHLHNPVLAYEVGDDFMKYFYQAERGEIDPFVLVVEGSIPNEEIKDQGYWAAMGTDSVTGQPIKTTEWIRPSCTQGTGRCGRRDMRDLWRHSRHGWKSYSSHGSGRLSGMELAVQSRIADRQRAWMPGAAGQFYGDAALSAFPGCWPCADDSAG